MNYFVIDANVAVKWLPLFSGEPMVTEAYSFLERLASGEIAILVPDLFWLECASVLWKAVRRGTCDPAEAEAALETLQQQDIETVQTKDEVKAALAIAIRHGRSIYDSSYVALAVKAKAQLVTADEKLANVLAAHLPVKWLGAL